MKKTFFTILAFTAILASCDNGPVNQSKTTEVEAPKVVTLKKYQNISEMIENTYDYDTERGLFKVISDNPLHIQLSKEMIDGDDIESVKEQVLRNIVYVGYRTFAQTDINEITITSLPLKWDMKNNKSLGYENKYSKKLKLSREKCESILEKYTGDKNFSKLFGDMVGDSFMQEVPSSIFKNFLYNDQSSPTLNEVFADLEK